MSEEGGAPEGATDNWRGEYAESLAKFETPESLGKSYLELEKAMGSRVKIPDMNDTEAVGKFYDKLGRPETPDKYEMDSVDGLDLADSVLSAVRQAAHEKGLNGDQFKSVAGSYIAAMKAAQEEQQKAIAGQNDQRWIELKKEWGEDVTKENLELAKRAVRDSELKEFMDDEAVERDPIFVSFVSNLMRKAGDDKLVTGEKATEDEFVPAHPNSPDMYANGEDEYSKKAREYFTARGHKY